MAKNISDFKVVVDGVLDVDASVSCFRDYLIESDEQDSALREEVTFAVNQVLGTAKGAIPLPALLSLVRGNLGRAQDMDTYSRDSEMLTEVLKSSVYKINRGPGGGVWLATAYDAHKASKKK